MRLIDADRLIKDILDLQDCYNGFSNTYDKACIIGVIDEQPTIERKAGKWIKKEKCYPNIEKQMDYRYECSECGFSDIHNATLEVPFCWHCGADMRG